MRSPCKKPMTVQYMRSGDSSGSLVNPPCPICPSPFWYEITQSREKRGGEWGGKSIIELCKRSALDQLKSVIDTMARNWANYAVTDFLLFVSLSLCPLRNNAIVIPLRILPSGGVKWLWGCPIHIMCTCHLVALNNSSLCPPVCCGKEWAWHRGAYTITFGRDVIWWRTQDIREKVIV